jgi:hypothetical protein
MGKARWESGWNGKAAMGNGKGMGREGGELYGLSLLTHSLARSVYLLIIVGSLDNTYMEFIPCHVDRWRYLQIL